MYRWHMIDLAGSLLYWLYIDPWYDRDDAERIRRENEANYEQPLCAVEKHGRYAIDLS